jgi:hypothetical protein
VTGASAAAGFHREALDLARELGMCPLAERARRALDRLEAR